MKSLAADAGLVELTAGDVAVAVEPAKAELIDQRCHADCLTD